MYSMKQFLSDLKFTAVISLTLFPPVFCMVFDLPAWVWVLWCAWMAAFIYANSLGVRRAIRKRARKQKFTTYVLDKEEIESIDLEDAS